MPDAHVLRVLTFTSLYPNAEQPRHCVFIEQRVRQLGRFAGDRLRQHVVAPVPWFPSRRACFGSYAVRARVPPHEERAGLAVDHPRYPLIPKVGMAFTPALLAAAVRAHLQRLRAEAFRFDLIDAHFLYPDGLAAVALGRRFGVPVVLSARGTDVHGYREMPRVWRRIVTAARSAAHVITVSDALRDPLVRAGVPEERVTTLRNGVDLQFFRPAERSASRAGLGLKGVTLLSVGNLVALKGHDLTIRALARLPGVELIIVGDGPERESLRALAAAEGVAARVRFEAAMPQERLVAYYSAADALVLASEREGWPNVLLEALACGTPVVAFATWGVPEVVRSEVAGALVAERSAAALAQACAGVIAAPPPREAVRRYAEAFSWDATSRAQMELFTRLCADSAGSGWRAGMEGARIAG